ncbi:hypothetical protein KL930_002260 [Ogataea haglerorum]|uniref:Aldoketomutase n=1 Tax=Ogataea haglerorum TaxID=1937702 RepID=A0AAN6D7W4_9ASCO|nr:uncharacterized protein KL911_000135 [Ogataea haglerorum]KAG7698952.1 hypothetical protein KL915_001244 [Ogataea haglerorum]KAG7709994.1 hypothetical protein KL914_000904 [Ogataea haglerorum]KAG7711224.1 hypothetical protein KL950_001190 [Ogataea haglerorum]KAG7720522.1 hypothetical protein KL913_001422 [Ogataea haglerorum]KAG7720908.1 hypothetical protein KL949_001780 [Ogataea haglerorum]
MFTNHTCLHVSNLAKSVGWYTNTFAMKAIKQLETAKYTSVFVAFDSNGHPNAGKQVAQRDGVVELRELKNSNAKVYDGNSEPYKGFGHLCVSVNNIAKAQEDFLAKGVNFKKRLEDGRQKNIAFVLDPDGYWVELIENALDESATVNPIAYRMNHSMIRVKDPKVSLKFYRDLLGMKLFSTRDFPEAQFTLYFLGFEDDSYVENKEQPKPQAARQSIIELTHNYGTESDDSFAGYYVFDKDTDKVVGFDHIAVSYKNVQSVIDRIGDNAKWITKFGENPDLKETALVADPDGYKIQLQSFDALS